MYDGNNNVVASWLKDYSQETNGIPLKSKVTTSYDALDRVLSATIQDLNNLSILTTNTTSYNDDTKQYAFGNAAGTTNTAFDERNREKTVNNSGFNLSYGYYDNDQLKNMDTNNGTNRLKYLYMNDKVQTIQLFKKPDLVTTPIMALSYEYYSNDKINNLRNGSSATSSPVLMHYTYTKAGQLDSAGATDFTKASYGFDDNGNLKKITDLKDGSVTDFTITGDNKLGTKTFTKNGVVKNTSYNYNNANGNLTNITEGSTTTDFSYNVANQLTGISKNTSGTVQNISYSYDANGNRTMKKIGNTTYTYYYDGNTLVKENINDGTISKDITYFTNAEGNHLGMQIGSNIYYYQYNARGDIIAITNSAGDIVAKYDYDPWGNVTISQDNTPEQAASINPFRYVGEYGVTYDTDTNLYFMGFRDYDPTTGRFIVPDTYHGEDDRPFSQNKYMYGHGDPVNFIDPSGYGPKEISKTKLSWADFVRLDHEGISKTTPMLVFSKACTIKLHNSYRYSLMSWKGVYGGAARLHQIHSVINDL